MMIKEGQAAPGFTLQATGGGSVSLNGLKGKRLVLYFYPKDNTSGCTIEACDFRDANDGFGDKDAVILGVSRDSIKSHDGFISKHDLNFRLLSDPDGEVCRLYGAWGKKASGKEGIIRTTVLIDEKGTITKIYNKVKVKGHVEEILSNL